MALPPAKPCLAAGFSGDSQLVDVSTPEVRKVVTDCEEARLDIGFCLLCYDAYSACVAALPPSDFYCEGDDFHLYDAACDVQLEAYMDCRRRLGTGGIGGSGAFGGIGGSGGTSGASSGGTAGAETGGTAGSGGNGGEPSGGSSSTGASGDGSGEASTGGTFAPHLLHSPLNLPTGPGERHLQVLRR